jgi:hypothetical protein
LNIKKQQRREGMKKVLSVMLLVIGVCLLYSKPVLAREFADIYTECGLGAMIAPRNEAVAAVTNVTWDSGTTAISSNITSPDTCKGGQEKTAAFIHESYESIASDISSGNGTHLDALVMLTGVNEKSQQQFKVALRNDFAKAVASEGYSQQTKFEKSQELYNLIYKNLEVVS